MECLLVSHTTFWVLTGALILSEAIGETKWIKSNGILSFIFELLEHLARIVRKVLYQR